MLLLKIALSGKMNSGKSTIAREFARQYRYKVFSIGDEIKYLANELIEDRGRFEERMSEIVKDSNLRKTIVSEVYEYYDENFQGVDWKKNKYNDYQKDNNYRLLLQEFPMIVRKYMGNDIFLRHLLDKNVALSNMMNYDAIIDDLRLPEEKKLLEEHGFYIVRLISSEEERLYRLRRKYGTIDPKTLGHTTEVALDNDTFDLYIETAGRDVASIVWEIAYRIQKVKKKREISQYHDSLNEPNRIIAP